MGKTSRLTAWIALAICMYSVQLQSVLLPYVSMPLFLEDRKFYVQESGSKLYPTSVYFLANLLLELSFTTVNASVYGTITFFLSLYEPTGEYATTTEKFLGHVMLVIAAALVGVMMAISCAVISPSADVAAALNIAFSCIFAFGAVPPELLSSARVIQWISPLKYTFTVSQSLARIAPLSPSHATWYASSLRTTGHDA